MNLLEKLQGHKPTGRFSRGGVADSDEVARIRALPVYDWSTDPEIEALGKALDAWLGLPPRQCPPTCVCRGAGVMSLRPVQVAALQALHDTGGMVGTLRVGCGKTLLSWLAPLVLDAKRPMLTIPAKLRDKTKRDFALLRRHWRAPERYHVMTYELLSRDRGLAELDAYRPDLVIADEAQKFSALSAACTKRMRRYMNEHDDAKYACFSGTLTKRSLHNFAHQVHWAIPDGLQAIPRGFAELSDFADAVDEKVSAVGRLMPGALLQFCNDGEIAEIAHDRKKSTAVRIVRQAYGRRLLSAPGMVGSVGDFDGAMTLTIQGHEIDPGPAVVEAFRGLRDRWETPGGEQIDSPTTLWRHSRSFVQGFYYRYLVPPPKPWLDARREWAGAVREALKNFHDIDSPLGVTRAVDDGRIAWAAPILAEWRALKDTFDPVTVPEWIDDACLRWAEAWARTHTGLIWVHEVAFGERLSALTGIPYYGAKGLCGKQSIEDETRTCIVSIQANAEGRNLQRYAANLIVSVPPGGSVWEQMLGRTHRDGQEADEVTADALLGCWEQWSVFRQARRDAEYAERMFGQPQKLNSADVLVATEEEIATRHAAGDPLWAKSNVDFFSSEEWSEQERTASSLSPKARAELRRGQ